jgi:hypothetical protein
VQVQKIRRATLVALAVGGLSFGGSEFATADSGGATAAGGFGAIGSLLQQNTAQEHRQNNNCANPNASVVQPELSEGLTQTRCGTGDASFNKHAVNDGGGSHATGGSGTVGQMIQQNTAQKGRQNNNCGNPNDSIFSHGDGVTDSFCIGQDGSHNKHTLTKSGGSHATGGSGKVGHLVQQNTAQEGRQNNNCANPNQSDISATDGLTASHCTHRDLSRNKHTLSVDGGSHATGGSGKVGHLVQQNTAQDGRQNNNCANPNDTFITSPDTGAQTRCATVDHSTNVRTAEFSGGSHATGGSGKVGHLVQQNTAQEGRQNNNCGNRNGMTLIASGNTRTQCVAVDESKNFESFNR